MSTRTQTQPQAPAKPFRPMLAEDATIEHYDLLFRERGPLIASFKLDGIRAIARGGQLISRSMKPIPNLHTQKLLSGLEVQGFDGELICGLPYGEGVFARSTSAFMSQGGKPDVTYHVFDFWHRGAVPFLDSVMH